jgi:hypothetical protein
LSARDALRELGIDSPETLAAWARRRGLLGVFIRYTSAKAPLPGHWQVIRPGYATDTPRMSDPWWRRGVKTFICTGTEEKNLMEERAKTWASGHFDVATWVRIENAMGGTLFPDSVGDEVRRLVPEIRSRKRRRQHT